MTLRKKHLKIGALILLGNCVLGGIALGVYFLFFHKEKSEPEPPYTTLIASTLRADTLSDITVTDNGSGDCYTFTDSAACTALLEGLQEIHLYRENSNQNPDGTSSYTVTLDFSGDAVRFSLKDGCCRNANGTVYDCGETARPFLTALTQQLREQTYSDAENIYQ